MRSIDRGGPGGCTLLQEAPSPDPSGFGEGLANGGESGESDRTMPPDAAPGDRRFPAEPGACPACGPRLSLRSAGWRPLPGDAIEGAAALLLAGKVVAIKGAGGYHLACDATNEAAVEELRRRKRRPEQPLPVMVATLADARMLSDLSAAEAELLESPAAPIVMVPGLRAPAPSPPSVAPSVAPGHRRLGLMLPSTPLHHLLLRAVARPLVMTSANRAGRPVVVDDRDARRRLPRLADAFLTHDRAILARADDSVVRAWQGAPALLRRSRGYVPAPLALPRPVRPTLASGAGPHGAFCLAEGDRAFLSPYLGDLASDEAMEAFHQALRRHRELSGIEPEIVAHDLDPDLPATRFARSTGLPAVAVQRHHAQVAAVMAEHGLHGRVIGVAFDGSGLGTDGTAWGGELLACDAARFDRVGHLRTVHVPDAGGAIPDPVRAALAYAEDAGVLDDAVRLLPVSAARARAMLDGPSRPTSSAKRLFDAVAALAGVCSHPTYEGQPADLLEQAASRSATFEYLFELGPEAGSLVLDTRPMIAAVVHDLRKGKGAADVAGRLHRTMAAAALAACRLIRGATGLDRVCLAGGLFSDDLLLSDLSARLRSCDFSVFTARSVPVGDEGIALGQVLVAGSRDERG